MANKCFRYHRLPLIILLSLFILLFIVVWIFSGRTSLFHTSRHQRLFTQSLPLAGNAELAQTFKAKYPGLYRIDILFQNQGVQDSDAIRFHLKETCSSSIALKTFTVPQSAVLNNEFHPFIFEPIDNSADDEYCLVLKTDNLDVSDGVGVYVSFSDTYLEGDATYKKNTILEDIEVISSDTATALEHRVWLPMIIKQPDSYQTQFDIGFQLYYRGQTAETLKILLTQLAAQKPYVLGIPGFYLVLLGLYIIFLIAFCYLVFKTIFE